MVWFAGDMTWSWTFLNESGDETHAGASAAPQSFPTQSDAENWLGESWRDLAEDGVASVSLFEEGRLVYGPMSLASG